MYVNLESNPLPRLRIKPHICMFKLIKNLWSLSGLTLHGLCCFPPETIELWYFLSMNKK